MKVSGSAQLAAPPEKVWDALLSPEVLVRTIPGCERLEATGENSYAMTVTAGVASIKGTYKGTVELANLNPHSSLTMRAEGAGAAGTIGVDVAVTFAPGEGETTDLTYEADAVVGGMIGGVGQRMLTSVSKRMAGEFFAAVNKILTGEAALVETGPAAPSAPVGAETAATAPGTAEVYAQPGLAPRSGDDLMKGIAIGAAVALAGVVVGAVAARRR